MKAFIWQCISMSHNWGATACVHVQGSFPDLENGWTDCAQIWYSNGDRLVEWRAKVSWDLLCTCARAGWRFQISRTAGPIAFKFGILVHSSTDRDRLVGCRASQLEAHPRSSARAGLNLSLARLSHQKASYWLLNLWKLISRGINYITNLTTNAHWLKFCLSCI